MLKHSTRRHAKLPSPNQLPPSLYRSVFSSPKPPPQRACAVVGAAAEAPSAALQQGYKKVLKVLKASAFSLMLGAVASRQAGVLAELPPCFVRRLRKLKLFSLCR